MKKFLCIILLVSLALSTLAGCNSDGNNEGSKTENKTSEKAVGTDKEEMKPITLTMFNQDLNVYDDGFTSEVSQKIKEETGVTLEIEYPVGDAEQKIALIAASGDYPDLMYVTHQRDMLIKQGAFVKLDELIEQYGPNIKKMYGDNLKRLRYSLEDKSIYNLGTFGVGGDKKTPEAGFALQWAALKELGYPEVKTVKDFEEVIKKYIERHPTIDGKPTIGLSLIADDWRFMISVRNPAALATGKPDDGDWYIDPETHEAKIHLRMDDEREYFRWLNHMNDIGLLDPESFVQKYDQYISKIGTGRVVGLIDADWEFAPAEDILKKDGRPERTYGLFPVQMTEETKSQAMRDPGYTGAWGISITTSCKDKVRAIQFLDYMCSEKTQIMINWGIEGKHYEVVDGKRVMFDHIRKWKNENTTEFIKKTGIDFYKHPWPWYGWGVKDSTGQSFHTDTRQDIANSYTDPQREGLKAYGAEVATDLYPQRSELPVSPYGFAWQLDFPTESEAAMIFKRYVDIRNKRVPQAILAKPSEFDTIWDKFQQELIDIGIEKAEKEFTKIIKDRIELWNE